MLVFFLTLLLSRYGLKDEIYSIQLSTQTNKNSSGLVPSCVSIDGGLLILLRFVVLFFELFTFT